MKKSIISILLVGLFLFIDKTEAQQVDQNLNDAGTAYRSNDLQAARFALQQSINEIDIAIGQEVLKLLPATLGNMPVDAGDESVGSASLGFAGLYVNRTYRDESESYASFQLIADSPLLTGINALLALPMIGSDPNQKRVRIGNYRGLLQRQQNDNSVKWDLQVPFGSSLITMSFNGFDDEKNVMDMANTIPFDQIARLVQ